jgi:hypothetical protein
MANRTLDQELLVKMATKTGHDKQYLREQLSRRASRSLVSSLAAQIQWAKELGIGVAVALRRAPANVREEIRSNNTAATAPAVRNGGGRTKRTNGRAKPNLGAAVDFILQDTELKGRCRDLLLAKRHYDRVVREAPQYWTTD